MRQTDKQRIAAEEEGKARANKKGMGKKNSKVKTQTILIKGLQ